MFGHRTNVWSAGWGLPLVAFLFSLTISSAVASSFLATAKILELPPGWFEGHFGVLAFLSQWGANISLMRARKNRASVRLQFLVAFVVLSICSGIGVHHVQASYRDIGYQAEVVARETERAADLALIKTQRDVMTQANVTIGNNSARTDLPAPRIRELNAGPLLVMEQANRDIIAAETRLAAIPPLPEVRPWDRLDSLFVLVALLVGLLEFVWYWGMQDELASQRLPTLPLKTPQPQAKRRRGLVEILGGALALIGLAAAPAQASPSVTAPPAVTDANVAPKITARAAPTREQLLCREIYAQLKSEEKTAVRMTEVTGKAYTRRQVRRLLDRRTSYYVARTPHEVRSENT